MSVGIVKKSTVAVKAETTFGGGPSSVMASTDVIRVESIQIEDAFTLAPVNEINHSKDEMPQIRTIEETPGNIVVNMRGAGTAGTAPEPDVLYVAAIGVKNTSTQSLCGSGSTTTSIVLVSNGGAGFALKDALACICPVNGGKTSTTTTGSTTTSIVLVTNGGLQFTVGMVVQIPNAGGTALIEAAQITAINGDVLTVNPALTAAPSTGQTVAQAVFGISWVTNIATDTLTVSPALPAAPVQFSRVRAGVHYKLTLSELNSIAVSLWRGDIVREDYFGVKIDSLEIDVTSGAVVMPKFTLKGQTLNATTAGAYALGTPTFNTVDPFVGVSQSVVIAGTTVKCSKFTFKLDNEIYDRKDITSPGISDRIQTGRKIEGSFDVLYEDESYLNTFKADTKMEAVLIIGRQGLIPGCVFAIRIPQLRYLKTPINVDNKLYKYSVSFQGQMTAGEDTFMMSAL